MLQWQPLTMIDSQAIANIAAGSSLARVSWRDRGRAPLGYIKGMAVMFAVVLRKLAQGDSAAIEMARAASGDSSRDALAHYASRFAALGMRNDASGADTLRHLFVLLIGLGMRESSGRYCEGRDRSASNTTADSAEAGLFQMSWDASRASPEISKLLAEYQAKGDAYRAIFAEGVTPRAGDFNVFGSGTGATFQRLCKECPGLAVETAAVGLRRLRTHWGPINRREVELRPEADAMLREAQKAAGSTSGALYPGDRRIDEAPVNAVELKVVQEQLKRLNYPVGDIDGLYGPLTRAALLAFQTDNHLPLTGVADAATVAALSPAPPRPLDMERVTAIAALLLALGSGTIRQADRTKLVALISSVLGLLGLGNSAITQVANYSPLSASPYGAPATSEFYASLATIIGKHANSTSKIGSGDATALLSQLRETNLLGLVSPENSQALTQLKALISPDVLKNNQELKHIFDQADRLRSANAPLRTIFDLMPGVFADGSVPQMMSDALATAASSIIPGFGGSLTMLGIGLAAHYFGNNIIQARVRDHATASNTRI